MTQYINAIKLTQFIMGIDNVSNGINNFPTSCIHSVPKIARS